MNKERAGRFNLVEYSFDELSLGKIEKGSDGERAMRDAIELGEKREEVFLICFQSDSFETINHTDVNKRIFDEVERIREEKLLENKDNSNYIDVYAKTTDWLGRGFLESGITSGRKLRYLIANFGKEDSKPENRSKRRVLV